MSSEKRASFFAVDHRAFAIVLEELGLSAAAVYLVLARGQGPLRRKLRAEDGSATIVDTVPETAWSAKAVGEYTSITWPSAKRLIGHLVKLGAITIVRASTKPKYRINPPCEIAGRQHLKPEPEWTWVPTSFVAPNKSNEPLIRETGLERLLQTGQSKLLQTLIQLYRAHDLEQHSGVYLEVIHDSYSRRHIGEAGEYNIWGFDKEGLVKGSCSINVEDILDLKRMGFLDFVPHVTTRYDLRRPHDCLIQYPTPQTLLASGAAHKAEVLLGAAHAIAATALLPDFVQNRFAKDGTPDVLVVERRHFEQLHVVGVLRLTNRPLTGSTMRWLERSVDWEVMTAKLQSIASIADRRVRPYLASVRSAVS